MIAAVGQCCGGVLTVLDSFSNRKSDKEHVGTLLATQRIGQERQPDVD